MRASWRHRLSALAVAFALVGAPASIIANSAIHTGTAVADPVCPAGSNWDVLTNSCVPD